MAGMCFDVLMTVETGCSKLVLNLVFAYMCRYHSRVMPGLWPRPASGFGFGSDSCMLLLVPVAVQQSQGESWAPTLTLT